MVTVERKKTDLVKERPDFFRAGSRPVLVHLEAVQYITLAGGGAPTHDDGSETQFQSSVTTLYGIAYALKRQCKQDGRDFRMPPLQATWLPYHSFGDCERDISKVEPADWSWELMIMVPDFIDEEMLAAAKAEKYDGATDSEVERVRLQTIDEGLCVQALHVGPYAEEHHTIRALREFMERTAVRACGLHHEIYLNHPERTAPEKLRVILRQPVRPLEDPTPCTEDGW